MKRIILLTTLMVCCFLCSAQQSSIVPYQKKEGGKWGYQDSISLEELYPCKFIEALPFKDGVAPIFTKKKWGLLGENGVMILPPTYNDMEYVEGGRFRVSISNKKEQMWGYIDAKTGREVIPVRYTDIGEFGADSVAKVEVAPLSNGYRRCGYIDWSGKEVIPPIYTFIGELNDDGRAWANYLGALHSGSTIYRGYHSIVSTSGDNLPHESYFILFSPREARELDSRAKSDSLLAPKLYFSPATIFNEFESSYYRKLNSPLTEDVDGYYFFTTGYHNKAGVITKDGQVVIPDKMYDAVSLPFDGKALVYNIEKTGVKRFYIYDVKSKNATLLRGSGLLGVADGIICMGDWSVVDGKNIHNATRYFNMHGERVGEDYAQGCNFHNSVAVVKRGTQYGVIDTLGREVIPFGKYQYLGAYDSQEAILAKTEQGQVGYINVAEEAIIPFDYQYGSTFRSGYAAVGKEGDAGMQYGLIDREGNTIVPCEYGSVSLNIYTFNEYFWVQESTGKWTIFNPKSQSVNSAVRFESLISHYDRLRVTLAKDGDKYALVSLVSGEVVAPLMLTDKTKLIDIYAYYFDRGRSTIESIDILRYIVGEKCGKSDYKLNTMIDEADWDY